MSAHAESQREYRTLIGVFIRRAADHSAKLMVGGLCVKDHPGSPLCEMNSAMPVCRAPSLFFGMYRSSRA